MTWDPAGWAQPGTGWPGAAAPALEMARDEVAAALRTVRGADRVAWSSPAAVRYRDVLAEAAAGLQAAEAGLDAAIAAVRRHDAAVDLAREERRWTLAARAQLGGPG